MKLKIYQVDAFAEKLFAGNPAAVVPLKKWLPEDTMQKIAMENNLAETAFFVPVDEGRYHLRWFTPENEVNLCGHATVASAFVLYNHENFRGDRITFESKSGLLTVKKSGSLFTLNFPVYKLIPTEASNDVIDAVGKIPAEVFKVYDDLMLVYYDEPTIQMLKPDFGKMKRTAARAILVTAPSDQTDFVYRFFAPKMGIDEDPATGSAQCSLTPFWAERLGTNKLESRQLSKRIGMLSSELKGDRVEISGNAVIYLAGEIEIPE